jgi:hypothetical protein
MKNIKVMSMFDYDLTTDFQTLATIKPETIEKYVKNHLPELQIESKNRAWVVYSCNQRDVTDISISYRSEADNYAKTVLCAIEDIATYRKCSKREVVDELTSELVHDR